jgi:precorrin 3B synthase CobZ
MRTTLEDPEVRRHLATHGVEPTPSTPEELARFMIHESKDILNWIVEQGVRWQPSLGGTLSLGRTNSFFLGGGRAMLNALYRTAEELGVDILYNAEVIDLNIEHGMFLSAQLKQPVGGRTEVRASTLVAAAGGFEANIEWLKQYWGEAADNFLIRGTPYNRGTILKMLLAKGVQEIGDPTQCHAVAIDARAPKFDGGIITRHDSVVFGIVVNKHAERFYDEGEDIWPKRYAIWGRLVAAQPDQIAYIIFDSTVVTSFMPTLFPPIAGATIAELAGNLERSSDVVGNPAELAELDAEFHVLMAKASQNRVLQLAREPAAQLFFPTTEMIVGGVPEGGARLVEAHRHILDAIRRRDKEAGVLWTRRHLQDWRRGFEKIASLDRSVEHTYMEHAYAARQ